jgi:outer membrane autotransporter protein
MESVSADEAKTPFSKLLRWPILNLGLGLFSFLLLFNPTFANSADPLIFPPGELRAVLSADSVNQGLINQGRATPTTLPFTSGTSVYEIRVNRDIYLARTYLRDPSRTKEGAAGSWVMEPNSLRGLSVAQVRDKFALPASNDYLTTVKIPAGFIIQTGSAGPIVGWGDGGGQQVLLISRWDPSYFPQQRTLVDQNLLFSPLVPRGNPGNMAAYLDSLPQPEPYSDWSVTNLLLGYLSNSPLTQALNQIGPERYDTLTQIDIQNMAQFNNNLLERRRSRTGPWPSSPQKKEMTGDQTTPGNLPSPAVEVPNGDLYLWGKAMGSFGRQDSSRDHFGYDYQTGSILAGVEKKMRENILFGSGLSLSRSGFSWNDNLGDGSMTQINLGFYGSVLASPYFVDWTVIGGVRKADVNRRIRFTGVDRLATSSPEGYNFAAGLDGGLNKKVGNWDLEPLVRMSVFYTKQDSLTESGADSLNLKIDQIESWTWRGECGLRLSRTASLESGLKIVPDFWLGFGFQQPLDNRDIKASLIGQTGNFTVNGYNNSSWSFLPRLGLIAKGSGKTSFFLNFAGDYRSDFIGHSINAGMQVSF